MLYNIVAVLKNNMNRMIENVNDPIKNIFLETLAADYTETPPGYSTGWRQLPCMVLSYLHIPGSPAAHSPAAVLKRRGKNDLVIPAGALMIISPREEHCVETIGNRIFSAWIHWVIRCGPGVDVTGFWEFPAVCTDSRIVGKTAELLNDVIRNVNSGDPAQNCIANLAGAAIMLELLKNASPKEHRQFSGIQRLAPAIGAIRNAPALRRSSGELAEMCFLSESRFRAVFHEIMGQTPRDFAENERIQLAVRYLREEKTLEEIAVLLGYCDAAHFSRSFRKLTGIAPGTYRKIYSGRK